MKILVTGCNGFIGSHLTRKLMRSGFLVEGITRSSFLSNYKVHHVDLQDFVALKRVFLKRDFQVAIHLAGETTELDIMTMFMSNVLGTLHFLECCRISKIKKFIFISGHNVYAPSPKLPISENDKLDSSTSYGITKILAEDLCRYYHNKFHMNIIILRVSFTYGNGQHEDKVISQIIRKYKKSLPIEIHKYKNGFQKLDLINVEDVCSAILKSIYTKKNFGIYNIASGKPVTIKEIVDILSKSKEFKSTVKIKLINKKTNHFYYNIRAANKDLSFKPKITIEKGICDML